MAAVSPPKAGNILFLPERHPVCFLMFVLILCISLLLDVCFETVNIVYLARFVRRYLDDKKASDKLRLCCKSF